MVVQHTVVDAMSRHCTEVHECTRHFFSFEVLEGSAPMVKRGSRLYSQVTAGGLALDKVLHCQSHLGDGLTRCVA